MHDVMLFAIVHSSVSGYCSITVSVTVHLTNNAFFSRNVVCTDAGNIETMSLELEYDSELMNIKQSL